jgi:hypothetical protein
MKVLMAENKNLKRKTLLTTQRDSAVVPQECLKV